MFSQVSRLSSDARRINFNPSIAHQHYRSSEAVFEPHLRGLHHIRTTSVLSDSLMADPRMLRDLHAARIAHLPVRVRDGTGLVGPLVLPRRDQAAWVVTRRNYPMSESEASAQITGISGGFIGTLRLSERTGKNRMVCTITMAGVEELESRELL